MSSSQTFPIVRRVYIFSFSGNVLLWKTSIKKSGEEDFVSLKIQENTYLV
ncbi:hypothetical protein GCM10008025_37400 [Ornithinibacillus halotolerans]|uniref:Uncharacterized protein n=1 Tax=Ornithinibacillus halotolerans TaxID=1274357 RepID=A0A916WE88_9BACI|nr:hypothetical protein GCM10008025_37400 [Ornithinibacillus halotolerans]